MENYWENKNVFITGATGFVGSWIAKTLVEKKANITIIERDKKGKNNIDILDIRKKVNVVKGDILDLKLIEKIIKEQKIDTVFHLAAQTIVGVADKSPLPTFETNIMGTLNILEASKKYPTVKRVVVASSHAVYGRQKNPEYSENLPLQGLTAYHASKVCVDILARSYHESFNLPVAITRTGNAYGGADMNLSRIIPDAICSTLKGKQLEILSDGTPERDYIYIKDVVEGHLTIAENLDRDEIKGQAFNLGTQKPISVIDLFNTIVKIIGKDIQPKVLGKAKLEIDKMYLSMEKAKKLLNWSPEYSLEKGLKETIEWYRENLNNFSN